MKKVLAMVCLTLNLLLCNCSGDSIEKRFGYGKEPAYAFGVVGLRVTSFNTKVATFEYDFVLYNESDVVSTEDFQLGLDDVSFPGTTTELDFDLESLVQIDAQPRGCYDVAVLLEHNAMERPDRLEVAARTIFKGTPDCNKFLFAWYPDRDKSLQPIGDVGIGAGDFTNDPFLYDQVLAKVSYTNRSMFEKSHEPTLSQYDALITLMQNALLNSGSDNKQLLLLYENNNEPDENALAGVRDYAIASGIVLNAIRSDFVEDDYALIDAVNATGGLYCYQKDTDFWHARNKPDAYAFARNSDRFFSGNYRFYRATYQVNTNKSFSPGYWFKVVLPILLPNDVEKSLPVYVTLK